MKKIKTEFALVVKWNDGEEAIVRKYNNKDEAIAEAKRANEPPYNYNARVYKREVTDWEVVE